MAEDDGNIRLGITAVLEQEGWAVVSAADGCEALEAFAGGDFALVILDVMMPRIDGYEVCRRLRRTSRVPIIMLTAKGEEIDKVVGLELGADDYVTKPFSIRELTARIHSLLRRVYGEGEDEKRRAMMEDRPFDFGPLRVEPACLRATCRGRVIELTPREVEMIRYFAERPGKAVSRDDLMHSVWEWNYTGASRTVDQHVAQLRKKIEADPARPAILTTVHGHGYRYEA